MRAVPASLDPAVVRRVDARLDAVVRDEGVAVPLAVESGSRAWGFPSPDSDYDCRFVYVRPEADYLDPWPRRDVVETPLDAVLDVNGWDLVTAVRLLVLTCDVRRVVIGGGVAGVGAPLLDAVRDVLRTAALSSPFLASMALEDRVSLAPEGAPVGAVGAAVVGRDVALSGGR